MNTAVPFLVGNRWHLTYLVSFVKVSFPVSVTNEGSFSLRDFSSTTSCSGSLLAVDLEKDASRLSHFSANGCDKSNRVSSISCSRSLFQLVFENSMDDIVFCLVSATLGTKFSIDNYTIHHIVFPKMILTEILLPNVSRHKRQVP